MALFTEDTGFPVYVDSCNLSTTQHHRGRALAPMVDELNSDKATMHFSGQSRTLLDGSQASGVTHCPAHHVKVDGWTRGFMVAAIGYFDSFVKHGGARLFSRRKLRVDWTETCPLRPV